MQGLRSCVDSPEAGPGKMSGVSKTVDQDRGAAGYREKEIDMWRRARAEYVAMGVWVGADAAIAKTAHQVLKPVREYPNFDAIREQTGATAIKFDLITRPTYAYDPDCPTRDWEPVLDPICVIFEEEEDERAGEGAGPGGQRELPGHHPDGCTGRSVGRVEGNEPMELKLIGEHDVKRLIALLALKNPIVFFDIESTGKDPTNDLIVQLAMLKINPEGTTESLTYLVNPGRPIPLEATAVHGITDADVKGKPPFIEIAPEIEGFIGDHDLCGYNILSFDIVLLANEMDMAGREFKHQDRAKIDLLVIERKLYPCKLADMVKRRTHITNFEESAHDAMADTSVCVAGLTGQLVMNKEIPRTVEELGAYCWGERVDLGGKFKRDADGEIVFNFSKKHMGRKLSTVVKDDRGFLDWILRSEFPEDVKGIIRTAIEEAREATKVSTVLSQKPVETLPGMETE